MTRWRLPGVPPAVPLARESERLAWPRLVDIPFRRVLSREKFHAVDERRPTPGAMRASADRDFRTGDTRRPRMAVLVRIPTPLRAMTKGAADVQVTADTV